MKKRTINYKEKGITLIALVTTIIVLVILASISISTLSGDISIIKKAEDSRDMTELIRTRRTSKYIIFKKKVKENRKYSR